MGKRAVAVLREGKSGKNRCSSYPSLGEVNIFKYLCIAYKRGNIFRFGVLCLKVHELLEYVIISFYKPWDKVLSG